MQIECTVIHRMVTVTDYIGLIVFPILMRNNLNVNIKLCFIYFVLWEGSHSPKLYCILMYRYTLTYLTIGQVFWKPLEIESARHQLTV